MSILVDVNQVQRNQEERFVQLNTQGEEKKFLSLTPAQIKNYISLTAGAGFVSTGAFIAVSSVFEFAAIVAPIPIALFCIAAGSMLFIVSSQFYDYDDKEQLEAYRKKAKDRYENLQFIESEFSEDIKTQAKVLLNTIANEHGWENMFYFGIPTPLDFINMYRFSIMYMTMNEEMEIYELVTNEYSKVQRIYGEDICSFEIPSPGESREKFFEEIRVLGVSKVLKTYDLDKLHAYEVLTDENYELFSGYKRTYEQIREGFIQDGGEEYQQYKRLKQPLRQAYQRKIEKAKYAFEAHSAHINLSELYQKQLSEVGAYRTRLEAEIQVHQDELKRFRDGLTDHENRSIEDLDSTLRHTWERKQQEFRNKKEGIHLRYSPIFQEINQKYAFLRAEYVRQIAAANLLKEIAIQEANLWYANALNPIRQRRNQVIGGEAVERYRNQLNELDERFCQALALI